MVGARHASPLRPGMPHREACLVYKGKGLQPRLATGVRMAFKDNPVINGPFGKPQWHYELGQDGQPTGKKLPGRRDSSHVVPVPAARRRGPQQRELALEDKVTTNVLVNEIRKHVDQWRDLPPGQWGVTPETQRLLLHWRDCDRERKQFFCQREAVETLIWLSEVEPKRFRGPIEKANAEANPGLYRLACKMATGAGKTTVMAMIITWQAVNRARRPSSRHFSDAFSWSRQASRSRTACACSSRRTRRTSMSISILCRATLWTRCAKRGSSSPTTTPSCCGRKSKFPSSTGKLLAGAKARRNLPKP